MSLQALAAQALERNPEIPAIEFAHHWHDWGAIRRVAESVQAALEASGIAADAPVAFVPRNRPGAIAALLGLIAQGRTIRMIYAFQSATGIARNIEHLQSAAVIAYREDFSPEVRAAMERQGMAAVALDDMTAAPLTGFERATGAALARTGPAEPQIEILTSGTTGPPKSFPVAYRLLEQHFINSALTRQQGDAPAQSPPFLLFFPLGNISGLYSTLPMVIRGQPIVLLERFTIGAWRDHVVRFRPAHSGLPPSCVQLVLDADIPKEDLASIKAIGVGAAPLDPTVQKAFEDRYGIPILISYGATEFAGPVAAMTADLHAAWGNRKCGTVGRAMPGARLRIVDPQTGAELPRGVEGLLEVVSPRIGPEWIRTSDMAMIDEDDFLFHRGRADGAIMRGGFKVLPESIERALMLHPSVSEAAVIGIADRRLGQVPAAAIRVKPGCDVPAADALEAHLRHHVLATHIPIKWLFCEELPRTPSLKLDRPALQRLFEPDPDAKPGPL
ncbi:class I adenylate-forming enzyme family protein [Sphingobium boeckii]|uniref:Acyl-coenzyme A synthetase/AMP-(Fatty) acid ligase n=1 Tax=Sphingobium boeckii TaxID=1082345 RepID=A0A7W9AJU1_9SPHN|nr:long-chain fatty acid--CoA ligase [Sphingobium boeckii]MBB5686739.1 acyl-coenzyme A synthetase/AMP-(fatty) acid ligase [Sphingobium boeckii]